MSTYATDRPIQEVRQHDTLLLPMIHQTHHLKKCNNQIPLLLPLPPVKLCVGRHTCLRLRRRHTYQNFSSLRNSTTIWAPWSKEGGFHKRKKIYTDTPVKKRWKKKSTVQERGRNQPLKDW